MRNSRNWASSPRSWLSWNTLMELVKSWKANEQDSELENLKGWSTCSAKSWDQDLPEFLKSSLQSAGGKIYTENKHKRKSRPVNLLSTHRRNIWRNVHIELDCHIYNESTGNLRFTIVKEPGISGICHDSHKSKHLRDCFNSTTFLQWL